MYCLLDNDKIIALHEDEEIVSKFAADRKVKNACNHLSIVKVKRKEISDCDYSDLYLIKYGETYIPYKYKDCIKMLYPKEIMDQDAITKETLIRILETADLTEKEYKTIEKAIKIVSRVETEDSSFSISSDELEKMRIEYEADPHNKYW